MALTINHDDIEELKRVFDDRYVKQNDCDNKQAIMNKKLANDDKRIEVMVQKININNWLTLAIAGGIISLVIKVFLGG